jgi:hypothetical protein
MEAAESQQRKFVRNILDRIEDFEKNPHEDLRQTVVPVSSWKPIVETGVQGTPNVDAYITFPKLHPPPQITLQAPTKQAFWSGQEQELVQKALEKSEFEWRTIPGIAKETGLDPETVARVLSQLKSQVVKSSKFTKDGRQLYTTRSRYRESASPWRQLLGAIKNRVD